MKDLVIIKNKQAVTTSLEVAKAFGKNHRDVIRTIENKISSAQNYAQYKTMFEESTYQDASGKSNKMYFMNRDGFVFIAMGFTGSKADKFKLKYIEAFNKMEQVIREQQLPQTKEQQFHLMVQVLDGKLPDINKIPQLEKDVDYLKNKSEIDSAQRYKLKQARNRKAVEACGGKNSNFYKTKNAPRKVFKQLEHDLKDRFMISRYEDLTKEDFEAAIDFINNWYPPYPLKQEIDQANAQTSLKVI